MQHLPGEPHDASPGRAGEGARSGDSRSAILDAAEALFAGKGFAGASMRTLAATAGVSQALIHHHFGTKAGLWKAVKERFAQQLADSQILGLDRIASVDPVEHMLGTMTAYADFLEANPHITRLAAWARLEGDDEPWLGSGPLVDAVVGELTLLQQQGQLRADLDVGLHVALVGGLVEHWVNHKHIIAKVFAPGLPPSELAERWFRQAASTVLLGALTPAARTP